MAFAALALREDGRPLPFQVTGARIAGRTGVEALRGDRRLLSLLRGHRMKMLLRRMLDEKYINKVQYEQALSAPR